MGTTSNIIPPIAPSSTGSSIPGNSNVNNNGTGSTSSGSGASNATNQLSLASNFSTFLTLLTTQLQNQDPTSPVDSTQFTQQLVEFAGVQQQVQTNTLLLQLVTATQGNQVSSASSYIGTTIQATGDQAGLTNGVAQFGYTLASAATNVNVTITDSSGNIVFEGQGALTAGQNVVQWDGINSFNGSTEPDGAYTVSVQATDANGNPITATPFETGVVSSASISNGTVMLNVNGLEIPEGNVTSITNLPGTATSTTPSASSGSGSSLGSALGSLLGSSGSGSSLGSALGSLL